ncbi:precorrin-2 C(20)-methyltransferase [Thermosulfurimonas marina]|uniref:precorrin-2 C(20)-methyltransferase n=1 Tax=Thermosulfurimonas marina TaxID=2047767 RepID=UPI00144A6631|nr:precorrin-2 C(20)-methyltransferase [Thermosulfurimonas marina]
MRLYGVGVGPGDPELLTLKALRVLQEAVHIFVASSSKNDYSLALRVVEGYLPAGVPVERLSFPMTRERARLEEAWEKNARRVAEVLREKGSAVFLTLGDPALFSTFGHLARAVRERVPEVEIEMVPGITAAQAAAARLGVILAEGEGAFLIASALAAEGVLRKLLRETSSLALYKVYRRTPEILRLLEEEGRLSETRAVSLCGLPEEKVYQDPRDLSHSRPPYFTLLLVGGKSLTE